MQLMQLRASWYWIRNARGRQYPSRASTPCILRGGKSLVQRGHLGIKPRRERAEGLHPKCVRAFDIPISWYRECFSSHDILASSRDTHPLHGIYYLLSTYANPSSLHDDGNPQRPPRRAFGSFFSKNLAVFLWDSRPDPAGDFNSSFVRRRGNPSERNPIIDCRHQCGEADKKCKPAKWLPLSSN